MKTSPFEHKPCGRCSGTGNVGIMWVQNGVCFGCGGSGIKYTKRGYAAKLMYEDSLKVAFDAIKIGDVLRFDGVPGMFGAAWFMVEEIGFNGSAIINPDGSKTPLLTISGKDKNGRGYGISGGGPQRIAHTAEAKQAKLAAALAFQDTLTKTGTPRKAKGGR